MKLTQKDFAAQATKVARDCSVFFFCGSDEAGVQDAASASSRCCPTRRAVEFTGAELRRDAAKLGDEARSTSLFGDRRYLWVRASGDEAHDALEVLVGGERLWPVIVQAPGATDKGKCAKLLEKRDDAVVAMFYPPDLRSVTASVRGMASAAGLRMANDLAERIAAASGLDTRLAQSEVTKLALYLDASPERPRDADMAAFAAIGAATEDDGLNPVVNAVLGGDVARLGRSSSGWPKWASMRWAFCWRSSVAPRNWRGLRRVWGRAETRVPSSKRKNPPAACSGRMPTI
jgi:DNA polymerase-3 subunit delta